MRGNAIYRNSSFDLDLANDGATANDNGDGDTGANNKQNYPQLGSTSTSGASLVVNLTLNSAAGAYQVDFYSGGEDDGDDDDCGAEKRGVYNPALYLGSATVNASSSQQTVTFTPVGLSAEGTLVATATSAGGDTSETVELHTLRQQQANRCSRVRDDERGHGCDRDVDRHRPERPVSAHVCNRNAAHQGDTRADRARRVHREPLHRHGSVHAGGERKRLRLVHVHGEGRNDTSPAATASVAVAAVNDTPSFAKGADQLVLEDAAPQSLAGWATGISKGPADESGQTLTFLVSNDNNGLFSTQPAVAPNGTLTYTPAANANGTATVTVKLQDNGGGADTSASQTFTISVTAVNDAPSFVKGADQTVLEDSGAKAVPAWATAVSRGPSNESSQALTFVVTNGNAALFSTAPALTATGDLSFTPAPNANGSATVTVKLQDDGGGTDTSPSQTLTITVKPVNDVPSFTKGVDQTMLEDAAAQSVTGWASSLSAGPADESSQTLSFDVSNTNNSLFSAQPAVAPDGTLTYTPSANANGAATVTVTMHDSGGTADGGVDTTAPQTFMITVTAVNDPPAFTKGGDKTVLEDPGAQVVDGLGHRPLCGACGRSAQTLTFTVTNDNNALFAAQPAVSDTGRLTYAPAPNANGSATDGERSRTTVGRRTPGRHDRPRRRS